MSLERNISTVISQASHDNAIAQRFMHYIEFQTNIIKLSQVATRRGMSTQKAFQRMLATPTLFNKNEEGRLNLCFIWPKAKEDCKVTVVASSSVLDFYNQDRLFLTLSLNDTSMVVKDRQSSTEENGWSDDDIREIVSNFNDALRAKEVIFIKNDPMPLLMPKISDHGPHRFDKNIFSNMIKAYSEYQFTYRLNGIISHACRRNNDFTFHLQWPSQRGVTYHLKAIFSRAELFSPHFNEGEPYSWLMSEQALLTYFPHYKNYQVKPGQFYYGFRVYEICRDDEGRKKQHEVLSTWTSQDGFVGELRTVHGGERISGNEVLDVYRYFDDGLFKTKNTFVCDASNLFNADKSIKIPLRLILALCTGQTWYQRHLPGLRLFECQGFKTVAERVIDQNHARRDSALTSLQALPLRKWALMLDDDQSNLVLELCLRHLDCKIDDPAFDFTLKDLAIKIYDDAKTQKTITPDLAILVKLLCEGTRVFKHSQRYTENDTDFWVKSRVEELLGKSRFWIRTEMPESEREDNETGWGIKP